MKTMNTMPNASRIPPKNEAVSNPFFVQGTTVVGKTVILVLLSTVVDCGFEVETTSPVVLASGAEEVKNVV